MDFFIEAGFSILKSALSLAFTALLVWLVAYRDLLGQSFFCRITFSFLGQEPGESDDPNKISITTLLDKRLSEVVIDNRILRSRVYKAAQKCDEDNPFVILPAKEMYHIKSGIRHQLSERYSDGIMDHAVGFPVRKSELLTCLCFMGSEPGKAKKIRAFVVRPDFIQRVAENYEAFQQANAKNSLFIKMLKKMHEQWQAEQSMGPGEMKLIHKVRIYRRES